jgi:hypothetical protein
LPFHLNFATSQSKGAPKRKTKLGCLQEIVKRDYDYDFVYEKYTLKRGFEAAEDEWR